MRTRRWILSRTVLITLALSPMVLGPVACQEETRTVGLDAREAHTLTADDPIVELFSIVDSVRQRALDAGMNGDDVRAAAGTVSGGADALLAAIGYGSEEVAALEERIGVAFAKLTAENPPPASLDASCATCDDDAFETFARLVDAGPSIERSLLHCEAWPLALDLHRCYDRHGDGFRFAMCAVGAYCDNCNFC